MLELYLHSCPICLDAVPFRDALWTLCGHGFCEGCILQHFGTRKRAICPQCRTSIKRDQLHRSYPTPPDPGEAPSGPSYPPEVIRRANNVTEKINSMNDQSPIESVERTAVEVQKVVDGIATGGGIVVKSLIHALDEFKVRILPQYQMVIRQQRELQCKIKDIESLENKIGRLTAESDQLRMASQHSERLVAEAFATTKVAKNRYDIELMKNQALQSTVQANEEKIYSQQKTIVAHKEKEARQKQKIEQLRSQLQGLQAEKQSLWNVPGSTKPRLKVTRSRSISEYDGASEITEEAQNGENENYDLPVASDEDFDVDPEPLYVNLEEDEGPYPTPPSPPKAQKPRFPSPWNLSESKALGKRKRNESSTIQRAPLDPVVKHFSNTLGLDRKGRSVKGVLQAGDRRRYKF